jgi:hypothetical protein
MTERWEERDVEQGHGITAGGANEGGQGSDVNAEEEKIDGERFSCGRRKESLSEADEQEGKAAPRTALLEPTALPFPVWRYDCS